MWVELSDRFLLSATLVYVVAALAFGAEFALARAAMPRRVRRVALSLGAPLERAGRARHGEPAEPAGADSPLASHRDAAARIAINLTVLAAALHGANLVTRALAAGYAPLSGMYEFTVAASFAATISYLVIGRRAGQLRELGLPAVLPIASAMLVALSRLYSAPHDLPPSLRSYWIGIHVTAAAIGIGALTIGAIGCAAQLKAQRDGRPELLPRADRIASAAFAFAFPVWTFAVMTGAIWAHYAWGRYWGWDPKEVWALISWVMLAAYLHSRRTAGVRRRNLALVGLIAYGTLLFNFVGVNLWFSGLHSYAGL